MKFCEFTAYTNTDYSEIVADIFWDYTNYGVAISDVNDVLELQKNSQIYWDYIEEELVSKDQEVLVKCYCLLEEAQKIEQEIVKRFAKLKELACDCGSLELVKRQVEGDDWIEIWKKHFRPINIGKVVVCPDWIKYDKKSDETVVLIGSNMAFGTGEHQTTSMCITLMQECLNAQDYVCDIGCGSGILAITALLLGAKQAILTDIDSIAQACAKQNAALNKVENNCIIEGVNYQIPKEYANVVFANITADVLIMLKSSIINAAKLGGKIILSGIIDSKYQSVVQEYTAQGLRLIKHICDQGWNAILLEKVQDNE